MPLDDIRPGELITAQFINEVLAELRSLHERIARLEAGGGTVSITNILPSRTVNADTDIIVEGQNFEVPSRFNEVILGSRPPITTFKEGSSSQRLIFTVPNIGTTPVTMPLIIRNDFGEARDTLTIQPPAATPLSGEVRILSRFEGLGVINAGETYIYWFSVTSNTNLNEVYQFSVDYETPEGEAVTAEDWGATTEIVMTEISPDSSDFPPESADMAIQELELTRLQPTGIGVQVTVPSRATSVMMTFLVQSTSNPSDPELNRGSDLVAIVVGEETEGGDLNIDFEITVAPPGRWEAANNTIVLPAGTNVAIRARAEFGTEAAGDYTAELAYEPDSGGWAEPELGIDRFTNVLEGQQRDVTFILNAADDVPHILLIRLRRDDEQSAFRRLRVVGE